MNNSAAAYRAYRDYLALDPLLDIQYPNTDEPAELLFIVVHQSHELWFKELLHELDGLGALLRDGACGSVLRVLRRARLTLRALTAQIEVLETLTPEQFDAFRMQLGGSGFYSAQFREIEVLLGCRDASVARQFPDGTPERERIETRADSPSVLDCFLAYLAGHGYPADDLPTALSQVRKDDRVAEQVRQGMLDLDESFQEWRYRHVVLVRRVIGDKPGTGGTSGVDYLRQALLAPAFPALWSDHR